MSDRVDVYLTADQQGAILTGRMCELLVRRGVVAHLAQNPLGPDLNAQLMAIRTAALVYGRAISGTDTGRVAEPARPLKWLTTRQAADRLMMTDRGIRKAIAAGRLKAEQDGRAYRIAPEDVAGFATRTARRAA